MSTTALAVQQGEVLDQPTLAALVRTIADRHARAKKSGQQMVEYAVQCGEALQVARAAVPNGEWIDWLHANVDFEVTQSYRYLRLAEYAAEVRAANPPSVKAALEVVAEKPWRGKNRVSEQMRQEMVRLRSQGHTLAEIGGIFGCSGSQVHYWTDTATRRLRDGHVRRRRRDAELALRRQERERAARKAGGSVAMGYSLLRRAAQELDRALAEAEDRDVKRALGKAIDRLHAAEDLVGDAVRIA